MFSARAACSVLPVARNTTASFSQASGACGLRLTIRRNDFAKAALCSAPS
jgi:hypothetical protein